MNNVQYNKKIQYYKNVPLQLDMYLAHEYPRLNAKSYCVGAKEDHFHVWIPNAYLQPDGTLKTDINLQWIFLRHKKLIKTSKNTLFKNLI